jgi:Protein of unknown function (DUF3738)
MREQTAYVLTVAKGGPKMKKSAPGMMRRSSGEIFSKGTQMGNFIRFLAVDLRRPVTDETGPMTAIEEQLGLRLESRKAPVETLIVERVEKASEN